MSKLNLSEIKTISQLIDQLAKQYSTTTAFQIRRRIRKEKVLYQDLPILNGKVAAFLENNNIKPGDKVLVFGLNCPEYAVLLLGILASGRIAVPIDFRTSDEVIQKIVGQTKPTAAFVSRFLNEKNIKSSIKNVFYIEELFEGIKDLDKASLNKDLSPSNLCEIVYTSGTTGIPKGVMVSQENILDNIRAATDRIPQIKEYRTISILPLSHMLEQVIGLFLGLTCGSTINYLTKVNSFKLRVAMKEVKPTYLIFVPQLLAIFWNKVESEAKATGKYEKLQQALAISSFLPRSLRKLIFKQVQELFGGKIEFIGCGGAPLNYIIGNNFNKMGFSILEGYGGTEVTAVATFNNNPNLLGNVGLPLEGIEIKLDQDNQILIKSKSVSLGYFNNPEKTKEAFVDGWYKTGDIGRFDPNGRLVVLGRDFFKIVLSSGEKVYVEDMEKEISKNPKVKDCCVIAVKEDNADKIHAVFIFKNSEDNKNIDQIVKDINLTLESKQQIFSYSYWNSEDFPRTVTLKIDRKQVSEIVAQSLKDNSHPEENLKAPETQLDILDILSKISKIDKTKIFDEDVLASDLNMDSLDRSELVSSVEENLGVTIDMLAITSKTTVADLKKLVVNGVKVDSEKEFSTWQFSKLGEAARSLILNFLFFPVHSIFAKLKVTYPDGQTEIKPGSILIFNHSGIFDVICIFRIIGPKAVKIISLGSSNFWKNKPLSRFLELCGGALPIDPTGKDLIPLLQKTSDLMEGRFLMLAPQGRLQSGPTPDRFKAGIGLFAQELQAPVVPIKLVGYEKIWLPPKTTVEAMTLSEYLPKKRGTVEVKIGKPLEYKNLNNAVEIANLIEEEFNNL